MACGSCRSPPGATFSILPPWPTYYVSLCYSPEGDYLYFTRGEPNYLYASLYQVPALGGTPRKLLFDIDTGVGFSPDGRKIAFIRGVPEQRESALMSPMRTARTSGAWQCSRTRNGGLSSPRPGHRTASALPPAAGEAGSPPSRNLSRWRAKRRAAPSGRDPPFALGKEAWDIASPVAWFPDGKGFGGGSRSRSVREQTPDLDAVLPARRCGSAHQRPQQLRSVSLSADMGRRFCQSSRRPSPISGVSRLKIREAPSLSLRPVAPTGRPGRSRPALPNPSCSS